MPRPREPEGRRVTICAKFSESEAAVINAAPRGMSRSEWVRRALLAAAEHQQPPAANSRSWESAAEIASRVTRLAEEGKQ